MKFLSFLFKLIVIFLSICGLCYIFVQIVDHIEKKSQESDDLNETEDICFFGKLKNAFQKEIAKI